MLGTVEQRHLTNSQVVKAFNNIDFLRLFTSARYLLQDPCELGSVTVVSGCQDEREGPASSLGDEVDLGGESAAGTSQTFADLTTSSRRAASFRSAGSTWFVPCPAPF